MAIWSRIQAQSFNVSEMMNSLIGRTTLDAIRNLVRKLNDLASDISTYVSKGTLESDLQRLTLLEGRVLGAVWSEEFIVSLGSKDGLMQGDHLVAFNEVPITNKKGEVIYRDRKEVAKFEIVDMTAETDRAKARLVALVAGGDSARVPQEGDVVRIDVDHARSVRGGRATPVGPAAGPAALVEPVSPVETLVRNGDRYFEDGYLSQALQQYEQASQLKSGDPAIRARIGRTHLRLKNFYDAETLFENILSQGEAIPFDVQHRHGFGKPCSGILWFQKGKVWYQPERGDHAFEIGGSQILDFKIVYDGLAFDLTFRSADSKQESYDFVPTAITRLKYRRIPDEDMPDQVKLVRLIDRLWTTCLK